jgi:hypothetical protein
MRETKTPEMIILPANPLKPARRLSAKEAALRMLHELAIPQDDGSI